MLCQTETIPIYCRDICWRIQVCRLIRIAPLTDHDIIKHLRRHGIDAESVNLKSTSNVGEAILDFCARVDPDILVMGAFGRAKLRALLFGGVARYILEHQNVPVLMSH
ncbi:universal stress protein [Pelagibacterium mangrovi]|uniref:universal stress protein n=1 Tax=Pelagibacterium mangrovi TaxID=3119828 RepID=UPI003F7FB62F